MSDETTKTIPDTSDGIMKTILDLIRIEMEGVERMRKRLDELTKKLGMDIESKENVPQEEQ